MQQDRQTRAKLNIVVSLIGQIVTMVCGLCVPSLMIKSFGSEVYGATTSIAQFLSYITLIEGGVGGVARASLYGPLARNDMLEVSAILAQVNRFFRLIAYIFTAYVLVLASAFKYISDIQALDWLTTFLLVIVISVSTFAQHYIGITNSILLQSAQKTYITRLISIVGTVLNTLLIVLLVYLKCNIVIVKLASSCVFVLQPIARWLYVKRNFALVPAPKTKKNYLKQRWNALGQHIAWFLHSNTDVAILTLFSGLKTVAVYSVYHFVTAHIQAIITSFSTGMEALFGEMLAKKEDAQLHKTFNYYETMISIVAGILLTTTTVLILPFVRLYTAGVEDQNYIEPLFSVLLVLVSLIYCLKTPYHAVVTAAGHFKQTQVAAYGETLINVGLSLLLVSKFNLIGVALGTVFASLFRFVFYVFYLSKNILYRKISLFIKRQLVNVSAFVAGYFVGNLIIEKLPCDNYFHWIICGVIAAGVVTVITLGMNAAFYWHDMYRLFQKYFTKTRRI